jgi:two-component system chemotaxis sensor kinase CheA
MDPAEYIPMFLSESQEHLQELNLAVVKLEEHPDDRGTVDEIFRIAHSLKGMSATMGFAAIAELTHEMENVFETLRQRSGALSREVVDTVLACLDALSGAIDAIEETGAEKLDPQPLIALLHGLARAEDAAEPTPAAPAVAGELPTPPLVAAAIDAGAKVRRVTIDLADDCSMPSVRAYMALAALADHGELIATVPDHEDVEQFSGRRFAAWLDSASEDSSLTAAVTLVSDVCGVEITDIAQAPSASGGADTPAAAGAGAGAGAAAEEEAPSASRTTRTVRVDSARLDQLMHFMGEVVIHRTAVEVLAAGAHVPELSQAVQELARSSQALQAMVMQVRMIPVEAVFLRFPRLVRDLSGKLGKDVELKLVGKETELDRTVVDALGDPLVHLVRNSLDHGLEGPEDRVAAGKPATGTLEIAARHAGGAVVIEVRDDGRGIDPARVAAVAVERGLITQEAAAMVDVPRAIELLFTAGFSTATETSDISGRGVGMDAVRSKIRELGGEIIVDSTPGVGTMAQIRLPLTLAIVTGLLIDCSGKAFAIPIERIERTLRLDEAVVRSVAGRRVVVLEDGVLSLLDGYEAFALKPDPGEPPAELAVIVHAGEHRIAIAVTQLIGQRELVTRPLPGVIDEAACVSGGAVLADGRIALIVDCEALAAKIATAKTTGAAAGARTDPQANPGQASDEPRSDLITA